MFKLNGHVAVVTGGNGGIGLGMARGLAKAGASLALWGRDQEKNARAADELKALGARAEAFVCDVGDEKQVAASTRATVEELGRIDSCFANAGVGLMKPFVDMTLEDWETVMRVNLTGVFLTLREAAKQMISQGGGGKLIATSSVGSLHGMPAQEPYAAAKAGVCALVRSLAVELARHDIQANAVLPGWVDTEMTAPAVAWDKFNEVVIKGRVPARRWGKPEDFEGVAVYLASEQSRYHNGDVLRVDGGYAVF
jgi:hypothetical protein